MVQLVSHGGRCCGIHHIHGFHANRVEEDIRQIDQWLVQNDQFYQNRTLEIVLTDNQCRTMEHNLLPALAERGFVLVSSFYNGNSGNICNVFHRVRDRRPLNRDTFQWPGQRMSPNLSGRLPTIHNRHLNLAQNIVGVPGLSTPITRTLVRNSLQIGDILRYRGPSGRHNQQLFEVCSLNLSWDNKIRVRKRTTGEEFKLSIGSFVFFQRPNQPEQDNNQPVQIPEQRFQEQAIDPAVEVLPDPQPIMTLYRNRFQDGRFGGFYDTLAQCEAAAPRCLTRFQRTIMNNGTFVDREV